MSTLDDAGVTFNHLELLFCRVADNACIKVCIATLISLIGGADKLLNILFILLCVDFFLGFVKAAKRGNISSKKWLHGIHKFVLYGVAVIVANQIQQLTGELDSIPVLSAVLVQGQLPIRAAMAGFLAANEACSCMVHLDELGVPVPAKLMQYMSKYRDGTMDVCSPKKKTEKDKE